MKASFSIDFLFGLLILTSLSSFLAVDWDNIKNSAVEGVCYYLNDLLTVVSNISGSYPSANLSEWRYGPVFVSFVNNEAYVLGVKC